jgi:hypothetical protein
VTRNTPGVAKERLKLSANGAFRCLRDGNILSPNFTVD